MRAEKEEKKSRRRVNLIKNIIEAAFRHTFSFDLGFPFVSLALILLHVDARSQGANRRCLIRIKWIQTSVPKGLSLSNCGKRERTLDFYRGSING